MKMTPLTPPHTSTSLRKLKYRGGGRGVGLGSKIVLRENNTYKINILSIHYEDDPLDTTTHIHIIKKLKIEGGRGVGLGSKKGFEGKQHI